MYDMKQLHARTDFVPNRTLINTNMGSARLLCHCAAGSERLNTYQYKYG